MPFKHDLLNEAWPCSGRPPPTLDRSRRVKLLGQFASDALAGREPNRESLLFITGAIQAWLAGGGSLEHTYLKVTGPAGSHRTPTLLWDELCGSSEGAQPAEDSDTVEAPSTENEQL